LISFIHLQTPHYIFELIQTTIKEGDKKMNLNDYVVLRVSSSIKPKPKALERTTKRSISIEPAHTIKEFKLHKAELSKKELSDISKDPEIKSIAPNIPMKLHKPVAEEEVPTAPKAGTTWGISAVGADRSPFTGHGITVAVLDTGIDRGHIAFNGIEVIQNDFTGEGNGDDNGHGTHVAATIFGRPVEGMRIGIASGIKEALIGKVLGSSGGGTTIMITEAIQWALNSGANVISMSLGMDFPGYVKQLVSSDYPVDFATSIALEGYRANINLFNTLGTLALNLENFLQPAIILAASGNESKRDIDPSYEIAAAPPSASEGILAIGALSQINNQLKVADFSNTKPDICAPGVGIISARNGGGLRKLSGTSMATPHASGIAALWAEKLADTQTLTIGSLTSKLVAGATLNPMSDGYDPLDVGLGIVQAPLA
jgi:subtilisin family serine protease